ncbi:hypothetical protein BO70DRAFT_393408 [Aspergillus heteromorphus CBS 117.55]|uniref:FAD-binding domain-containing protein n=1 Tax=Aspergillus heteromorphus CBS 117.55 TaxID=1448321 RepID=A0A317WWG0_9EURO|nr:uncharacterized protein BO70DRAFT_393408 [Aspergillus heteromorphus CBS 117.55]PWY90231.1 hypothetical protein BO70DRAFT_393408 [Aspergillus heteromorphus CBS 117.55]
MNAMSPSLGKLDIPIVGAGLGGLFASLALRHDGHRVTAIDSSPEFREVSILDGRSYCMCYGIFLFLNQPVVAFELKKSTCRRYHFVRWEDGSTITKIPLDGIVKSHGTRYYLAHRADLHASLLTAATRAGIAIHTNQHVTSYDFTIPMATTAQNRQCTADLIIGHAAVRGVEPLRAHPQPSRVPDPVEDTTAPVYSAHRRRRRVAPAGRGHAIGFVVECDLLGVSTSSRVAVWS